MDDVTRGQVSGDAAEVYDRFFVPALFGQWPSRLLDAAAVRPGDRVLDVGCGTGIVAGAAAARVGPAGDVAGIDPNDGMLAVARRRPEHVRWHQGRAEDLPFDDAAFDVIVCQFAAMFFGDPGRAAAEMARVAEPGGTVAVATWAALERSPGYAAMVDVVRRTIDEDAADALRVPFRLGTAASLHDLLGAHFRDVTVVSHDGEARFDNLDAWVHTDIRGWTLAGRVSDVEYAELLAVAHQELAPFVLADGHVAFAAPALIATATAAR